MEKNNTNHILYLVIIVLLIVIIVMLWYQLSQVKISNRENINQLQDNLSTKDSQIATLENSINNLSNRLENTSSVDTTNNSNRSVPENNSSNYTEITNNLAGIDVLYVTNAIKNNDNTYTLRGVIYTQYTISASELNQIKNSGSIKLDENTYTVKANGNEFDVCDSTNYALFKIKSKNSNEYYLERQAQLSNVWKLTNEYKEITVSGNTTCTGLGYDPDTTVAENFKNYEASTPSETTTPDSSKTYSFVFQNGKCTKVVNELTRIE